MGDLIAGTAIGWSLLVAVALMEARDARRRRNDEGRGAHPDRSSVHHSAGVLAESPERA